MTGARIFIVEDENIVALDMQKRLDKLGYSVPGIASTGPDAVKKVLETRPDLVLMDIKLIGDMDGIEAAEQILAAYSVPIVYITAYTEEATLRRAKITEPFGYILKPFEERELHINIEIALYRHKMQNMLKEREQLFSVTLESIDDAVITTDAAKRVQFVNPAGEEFTGVPFKEAEGKLLYDILTLKAKETDSPVNLFRIQPDTGRELYRAIARNGRERSVQVSLRPLQDRNGDLAGSVIILHDFTEREKAEEALRESEERYREFFEDNLAGDFITDVGGKILACNTSFANTLGFEVPGDVMQYNIHTFFPEFRHDGEFFALLNEEKRLRNYKLEFVSRDRQPLFFTANIIGEYESGGGLSEIKWHIIDNTESIRIQEQFLQSQKMEGIGRLAGGIAHDFNNLLGAIIGYADLLLDTLPDGDAMQNDLESIRKAGRKAAALTRQLLAFSRRQVLQPKILDINNLITDLEKMLKRLLPEDIKLISILEEGIWRVKVDPIQIEQVLINLAVNARDAMPEGGRLTIATQNIVNEGGSTDEHFGIPAGSYVMIKVTDTGVGISEDMKQRIFEPFFTTKEPGKGTGLGLSTVYGIIKQSEGYIYLESILNRGTTFFIYLPRIVAELSQAGEKPELVVHKRGTESILLVEDEDVFREMVHKSLENYGYHVLNASNPGEALLICEQYKDPIELLLTDVVMPHLSGIKLAERLLTILSLIHISEPTRPY